MALLEIIAASIYEGLGSLLLNSILEGIGKLIRSIYYGLRKLITGKDRNYSELKRLEARLLNKKVKLKAAVHAHLPKGTFGKVVAIVDLKTIRIAFQNSNGQRIVIDGQQAFDVKRSKVILLRRKREGERNQKSL